MNKWHVIKSLCANHDGAQAENYVWTHAFLTSTIGMLSDSDSRPGLSTLKKDPSILSE